MRLIAVKQCGQIQKPQCDTTLDKVLIVGIGRAVVSASAEVEGVGSDEESSMGSGTMSAVESAVDSADVEGLTSSSTIFFIRTIKFRFDQGSV
jgi:hypothetical protein